MLGAVKAGSYADLLAHARARCTSLGTIDDVSLWMGAAAVEFVEVLRTHDGCFALTF